MAANWLPIHKKIREVIRKNEEVMLWGGAGSSKTWTILKQVFLRALAFPESRHICLRQRFEHTKTTLWPSAKDLAVAEFGQEFWERCETNRSGGVWKIMVNDSEILFGGLDDKERVEKHLGAEYATVYINECSEIMDSAPIDLISSRLRQKINGRHMLFLDMNPPARSHWSYKRYIEEKVSGRAAFRINPRDVKENLPASYIKRLKELPERLRKRFYDGEFLSDIEGALWSFDMIESTRRPQDGLAGRTVIAIDPAVTANKNSDETGIIGCGAVGDGFKVYADRSGRYKPSEWAHVAVKLYDDLQADAIVVEVNQGGDLVKQVIKSVNQNVKIVEVRATKGKYLRAEPIASLYEQGKVEHAEGLEVLETQLQEWVPESGLPSPDRLDALVWGLTELALKERKPLFFA